MLLGQYLVFFPSFGTGGGGVISRYCPNNNMVLLGQYLVFFPSFGTGGGGSFQGLGIVLTSSVVRTIPCILSFFWHWGGGVISRYCPNNNIVLLGQYLVFFPSFGTGGGSFQGIVLTIT